MLTPHQEEVVQEVLQILSTEKRVVIKGSAGVGKTFLLDVLIPLLKIPLHKKIYCSAPTNKAVAVIKGKVTNRMNVVFITTHSALKLNRKVDPKTGSVSFVAQKFNEKYPPLKDVKVLIVDEASMIPSPILEQIEQVASERNCTVIFLGDEKQLNPVNEDESPVFHAGYPTVELTEIVRQGEGNPIIELSRNLFFTKRKQNVFSNLAMTKGYLYTQNKVKVIAELSKVNGTDEYKYLAWTNKDVNEINTEVRKNIYGNPNKIEIGETLVFNSPFGKDHFTNEEIKVERLTVVTQKFNYTNNNKGKLVTTDEDELSFKQVELKCYMINGLQRQSKGCVGGVPVIHEDSEEDYKKIIALMKTRLIQGYLNWRDIFAYKEQFADLTYNHAITVHKSQGSTYKNTIINLKNINFNRNEKERTRLLYTAITRASDLVIFYNK